MKYEEKFAEFLKGIEESKKQDMAMLTTHPGALGDNYEELVESLERLAEAEIALLIMPKKSRHPDLRKRELRSQKFYVDGDENTLKDVYKSLDSDVGGGKSRDLLKK